MSVVVSQLIFSPFKGMGSCDFFLNPIFLRFFTASIHLILFAVLFTSCLYKKISSKADDENPKTNSRQTSLMYYKTALFSSLGLSIFNLILCLLNLFYWYKNGWSDEKISTFLDFGVKAVAWLALYLSLLIHYSKSMEAKYPLVLRLWWGLFFSASCYCLVIDFVYFAKHYYLSSLFWVSDIVSFLMGLIFCCIGFIVKNDQDNFLQEPLLNNHAAAASDNIEESSKSSQGDQIVTPYSKAGILSLFTFSWMSPLISLGYKKRLDLEDVPQLAFSDTAQGSFPILNAKLETYREGSNRVTTLMLAKALFFTTWREITVAAFYVLVYTVAAYVGPFLIETFVQYLNGRKRFEKEGYVLISVFFIAKLLESLAHRHWFFKVQQGGYRARAALVSKIYNKGLTLSSQSRQGHTTGEIINFMSVDAERIEEFGWYLHDPWMFALQVALALVILYRDVGLASIAAFVATVSVMLVNMPVGKLEKTFQENLMKSKDGRMKATSEVLRNMRILKLQAWEMKFLSKILDLRKVEMGWLRKYVYTSVILTFVAWGGPTFVSVVTFVACMLMGIPLESGKILSALATFRILQEPIYAIPDVISVMVQTKVSLDRIATFLSLDDLPPDVVDKIPFGSSDTAIEVINGNFSWQVASHVPTLREISFRVSCGMRVAVCGMVGSGKSSLISCVLGEMPKISGVVRVSGSKAYVAQSPWIQSGKVEENILFGKMMDRQKYNRVLEACSLNKDLEILPFGDQTVIGERGINLSGGQKQRIQIARALYQDADIYLFDDPFSAVDAHTGTHLFNECIMGLLGSKTVIFVSHQIEFLPAVDLILVMKDGTIKQAGKYNDILTSDSNFMELVGAHEEALSGLDSISGNEGSSGVSKSILQKQKSQSNKKDQIENDEEEAKAQLVQEEEREKGNLGVSVYWKYITTAYGGLLAPVALLLQIVFQALQIGSNYWMAWATPVSKDVPPHVTILTLILVYAALSIGSSFCILARALAVVTIGFKTANVLFSKMHLCIFRSPMSFFDSTPSGRILNRASTDQSTVDLNVASIIGQFAFAVIRLLGVIVVMSQVTWQVFIVFIPVIAICMWLQRYYIASARELARLCGVSKAPVIQHFSETLSGSSTIRGFNQESRFRDLSMKLIDAYSRPKLHTAGAMEWLCLRLDMLSLLTFAFSLILLISIPEGTINPSVAGLAVTYGLSLNMLQATVVRILCFMENKIISVERILQYTCIPAEPPLVVNENRPENVWPLHGEVDIHELQLGDEVRKKTEKLDSAVYENGENWSVGQRQLVCLGRVLLKKSKLLVLDEATASVDTATDNLIQQTLKRHFTDSTIITIAHRITSVLDSDMVLLLDNGLVKEYDTPGKLLENKFSSFTKLVAEYSMRSSPSSENLSSARV
ncbi:multidrug resistance protein ABC transporter [Striga asiatica]|uniref:ABC-type xenobiotic transporter n=1 Tax=Striga asiatica TaxID=4170 RepID=A0A5A7PHU1_STRAF|nr:multidrug resistance protein ABC transporter [Striga asiatica]